MKGQVAAEWAGFAAGAVIAGIVWIGVHPEYGWKTAAHVQAASAQAEQMDKPASAAKAAGEYGMGPVFNEAGGRYAAAGTPKDESDANGTQNGESAADGTPYVDPTATPTGKPATGALPSGARGENFADGGRDAGPGNSRASLRDNSPPSAAQSQPLPATVNVYLTEEERIESVPLEIYVRGVVAAEMPADFHPAALAAQALAARTYMVRRLLLQDDSGVPVPGADVTDTQTHQAYRPLKEMNRLRAEDEASWRKYNDAAASTKNRIIAYEGEPIQALYFSTSNGFTENSEDVFPNRIPYLRSVASPWDGKYSPRAEETVKLSLKQFYEKLGVRTVPAIAAIKGYPKLRVKEWTEGKRVKTLSLGSKTISGPDVREKLGLRSAAFTWSVKGGQIAITTFGSGHGVGMSQWGAEGMAQAGYTAEQIIQHYYTGTKVMEVSKLSTRRP